MRISRHHSQHTDFRRRVKAVDPKYYHWGERGAKPDATKSRPVLFAMMGFAWAYLVISVSRNKTLLEESLAQGSLTDQMQSNIVMVLAALLAASGVLLMLHLGRFFLKKGGKSRNSGGLLVGALGALMLVYTPPSVFQAGYSMLDTNSRTLLMAAHNTVTDTVKGSVPTVDFGNVAFVSSQSR
ncbi:MAG: hypothetical protein QNJ09_13450 [Paracoccaceae bacterium]|nr:hypothetical protein [Paracoccaceae bacterium]